MINIANIFSKLQCKEITPHLPFPFNNNRISHGTLFQNHLILFPFYIEYKKCQHLYSFDLKTLEWSSLKLKNSPEILTTTDNYSITRYQENKFVLFGSYKTFTAAEPGNLFNLPQLSGAKTVLGFLNAKIDNGKLSLEWEESPDSSRFPYLIGCSIDVFKSKLYIFGGMDKDENMTNSLIRYDIIEGELDICKLKNENIEKDEIPWPRMNHGSNVKNGQLYIFGGELNQSDAVNDLWAIDISFAGQSNLKCVKLDKTILSRRPKPRSPSIWLEDGLFYIGRSTSVTYPPIGNYLMCDRIKRRMEKAGVICSKKNLPFDSLPHTMEIFEDQIILGFKSSIYKIPFEKLPEGTECDSYEVGMNRYKKSFPEAMREYFEERLYADVTFKVQDEMIKAHRGILSVRSPFFHELFINNEDQLVFEISDLSPEGFTTLLEWLYCNGIPEMKEEVATELFRATEKYSLPKLKVEAERVLLKSLTIENLFERAKMVGEHGGNYLEGAVVKFIIKEIDEVHKRYELNLLPKDILYKVCKGGS